VTVTFDGNDPEASTFAADLIKSFEDGGAVVIPQSSAVFVGQMPLFGLFLQAALDFNAGPIEHALSRIAPIKKNESLKSFPDQNQSSLFLYVGHKSQPF
jgi:hypothetical protein